MKTWLITDCIIFALSLVYGVGWCIKIIFKKEEYLNQLSKMETLRKEVQMKNLV
jgi:hypothetical protein